RQRPGLLEQQHVFAEHHQGRNRTDAQGSGQLGLFFGVDLGEGDVRMLPGGGFEGRAELAAGAAPGRPEIDDQGLGGLGGGLEGVLGEFDDAHEGSGVGSGRQDAAPGSEQMGAGREFASGPPAQARNNPWGLPRALDQPGNRVYLMMNRTATSRVAGWMSRKRPDSALIAT